jgi:NADH:ubiquinone oxidoreductase subunit 5 (subunit L)/multisubunit Na+/H+ antiporter MnhA subunit
VLLSLIATPFWPWFEEWLHGKSAHFNGGALGEHGGFGLLILSLVIVTLGVGASWMIYRKVSDDSSARDPLSGKLGGLWKFLENAMGFDAFYEKVIIGPLAFFAGGIDMLERMVFVPLMGVAEGVIKGFGKITRATDDRGLNKGFDGVCSGLQHRAESASASQSGRPQSYLRAIGLGMSVLLILYFWLSAR